ncbi:MAG: DoxX family protein [Bacteroidales bacterium]|nr:DoxX family protein [Bacteroidales bacterium]
MKKTLNHTVVPWFILTSSLVLGYLCSIVTEFNWNFSIALALILTLAILYRNNFGKPHVAVARTLLGLLFMFSGFVKGIDPLGTQYQVQDYFSAYGTTWANPLSMMLSLALITAEFVVGVALILNLRISVTAWITVLMMGFFTITTWLDATIYSDKITDCGCFGKAITLSNWQTFFKNLVLNIWVVILFFGRYRIRNTFSLKNEVVMATLITILFLSFQFYNLRHLPVIDFLDWKVGVKLNPPKTEPVTYLFTYKNKETQDVHEFDSKNLPADLSTNWEFMETTIIDPNPRNLMIPIFDNNSEDGYDVSDFVADYPGYFFILAVNNLKKAKLKNMDKIFHLKDFASQHDHQFMFLFDLNTSEKGIKKFRNSADRNDFDIYFSDDKSIKAIVRSNPGLILLHDGVVVKKWAWRDLPTVEKIQELMK